MGETNLNDNETFEDVSEIDSETHMPDMSDNTGNEQLTLVVQTLNDVSGKLDTMQYIGLTLVLALGLIFGAIVCIIFSKLKR